MPEAVRGVYEREPGSGIWWIRWTDADGKLHREKVGRRGDAIALAEARRTAKRNGKKPELCVRRPITFGQLCADAKEHSKNENSVAAQGDLALKMERMRPVFGNRDAANIGKQDITRWLNSEAERCKWKDSTRNRWQAAFSLIFRVGIDNERIERNPAAGIKRKTENNGRVRFLSADEEARLVAVIQKRFSGFLPQLQLSLHTGMRASEQFGLKWSQVDLERGFLTLPKTKNGTTRHIPLNAVAMSALKAIRKPSVSSGVSARASSDLVFPSIRRDGEGLRGARGWFVSALKDAKVADYTWHCNRHTFASRLVMAGVDIRTVGELLGHKSLSMTMRYSHLAPAHNRAAVDRLVMPAA